MTTTTEAPAQTSQPHSTSGPSIRPRSRFLRHYVEMVVAMFVGMAVLGGALRGVLALMGLELSLSPAMASLEMAVEMSLGMAVWMRYRGHGWASTSEMVAAMFAVPMVMIPLVWLDLLASDSLLMAEHTIMLPLMYLVMLRRRHEHAAHTPAHAVA